MDMAYIVIFINRWITRALETWGAVRVHRAEREIACFLDLLGSSSIDPEVKEQLVADFLANRPLSIHASQLESPREWDRRWHYSERLRTQWTSRASRRSSSRTSLR